MQHLLKVFFETNFNFGIFALDGKLYSLLSDYFPTREFSKYLVRYYNNQKYYSLRTNGIKHTISDSYIPMFNLKIN